MGEHDGPALESLTDIKLEYTDDYSGFKLSFHFAPNDFFSNEVLTKSYTVSPDLLDDTAPALTSGHFTHNFFWPLLTNSLTHWLIYWLIYFLLSLLVDGTEITWKDKKNLCQTETKKKQKSKKGGQVCHE